MARTRKLVAALTRRGPHRVLRGLRRRRCDNTVGGTPASTDRDESVRYVEELRQLLPG